MVLQDSVTTPREPNDAGRTQWAGCDSQTVAESCRRVPALIVQPTKTTWTALWDRLEALRQFRSSYGQSCEVGRLGMKSSKTADRLGEQTRGDLSRAGRGRGLFKTTRSPVFTAEVDIEAAGRFLPAVQSLHGSH